jgi:hypothetical protein
MPAAFREGGPLAEQGKAMRDAAARLDQEDQEGQIKPESINALQDSIDRAWDGLDKTYPAAAPDARRADNDDTRTRDLERHRAERYLKAVSGFARMLEAPQMESLLADVERRDAVTIGSLISFMTAFNLQFGPAEDAETEATYAQLYPMLANLHQDVAPQDKAGDADRKADRGEAKDQPKERAETKNAGAPSTDARARTGGDAETKPKARDRDRVPYDFFEGFDEKDLRRPRRGAGAGAGEEGRKPAVKVDRETERKPQGGTPRRDVDPTRDVDPAPEPRKASDPPLPNLVNPPAFTPSPNNNRATGKPGLSIPPEA